MNKKTRFFKRIVAAVIALTFVFTGIPRINVFAEETKSEDYSTTQSLGDALLAQLRKDNGDKDGVMEAEDFLLTDEPVEIDRGKSVSINSIS